MVYSVLEKMHDGKCRHAASNAYSLFPREKGLRRHDAKKQITKNCKIRHSQRQYDEAQATEIHDGDQKICQNEII